MIIRFDGKVVAVSGAGHGFGREIARTFARLGALVFATDLSADTLEETASSGGITVRALDLRDRVAGAEWISRIETQTGRAIDVLVNNAGIAAGSSLLDMEVETWDQVLNVNLKGAWLVARATAKHMIASNTRGSIINVSSVLGSAVQKGTGNYPAAKAALTHLTRCMAVEWARFGIRVNALAPGYFATDLSASYLESAQGSAMLKRIPQRRLGSPDELSGALLLLASQASNYMTGCVVTVDGGLALPVI